jgi:hypothetical protein
LWAAFANQNRWSSLRPANSAIDLQEINSLFFKFHRQQPLPVASRTASSPAGLSALATMYDGINSLIILHTNL